VPNKYFPIVVAGDCLSIERNGLAFKNGDCLAVDPYAPIKKNSVVVLDLRLPHEGRIVCYLTMKWLVSEPPAPGMRYIEVLETYPVERVTRIPLSTLASITAVVTGA
jgi:hypothetical protein